MFCRFGRQTVQRGNETKRSVRPRNSVSLHQIFCQQQIPDGREDRDEQNPYCCFALVEQTPDQFERTLEVAGSERISQFENDAPAGERHQLAHLLDQDPTIVAQIQIDFFQFVLDLSRIAARQQHKKIERFLLKLQAAGLYAAPDDVRGFFFPAGTGRVETRLAPLYDIVCTVGYPELSGEMAMKIGDQYSSERVTPGDFENLAEDAGLGRPLVKRRVSELAEDLLEALPAIDAGKPAAEKAASILRRRAETAMRSFAH